MDEMPVGRQVTSSPWNVQSNARMNNSFQQTIKPQNKKKSSRPVTHVCYICGREYGSASISFHQSQCLKMFEIQNGKLPPIERRRIPVNPSDINESVSTLSLEERNDMSYETYKQSMVMCFQCGRRFSDSSRLGVHNKSCTPEAPAKAVAGFDKSLIQPTEVRKVFSSTDNVQSQSKYNWKVTSSVMGPRSRPCTICGRELLITSASHHEEKCRRKAASEMKNNPNCSMMMHHDASLSVSCHSVCLWCGRKFSDSSRLSVHHKSCSITSPAKSVSGFNPIMGLPKEHQQQTLPPTIVNSHRSLPKTQKCKGCGRECLISSIDQHEQQCLGKSQVEKNPDPIIMVPIRR